MYNLEKFKGKELLVRKKIAGFIENIFKAYDYDFDHDRFKKVVYGEDSCNCSIEEKIKSYYDAYCFLLSNSKNALSVDLFNKFLFILFGETIDYSKILRIVKIYFEGIDCPPFESAVDFHIKLYEEMEEYEEMDRTAISLMLFNYSLVKNEISSIKLLPCELKEYFDLRQDYKDGRKIKLYDFIMKIISNEKFQDKTYYKNLTNLSIKVITNTLIEDKEYLINKLNIKGISIFGSFSKGIDRIDSDIDLLISFSFDLLKEEKEKNIELFKNIYFKKFNRFIDVTEVSEFLNDDFIKKITHVKKIF